MAIERLLETTDGDSRREAIHRALDADLPTELETEVTERLRKMSPDQDALVLIEAAFGVLTVPGFKKSTYRAVVAAATADVCITLVFHLRAPMLLRRLALERLLETEWKTE